MEKAAGVDLSWFFRQWLHRPGSPILQGVWHHDPATQTLLINLEQVQSGDAYRLPLRLAITFLSAPEPQDLRIEMTRRQQSFAIKGMRAAPSSSIPGPWS